MKRLVLLLLPLLAACAPAMTANNTPFKPGQSWVLSSQSALDPKLPASTTFTLQSVKVDDDGNWRLDARHVFGFYSPDDDGTGTVFLVDDGPLDAGADHVRACLLVTRPGDTAFTGSAAHTTYERLRKFKGSDSRAELLGVLGESLKPGADPDQLAARAFVRSLDPADVSTCTLSRP